MNPKTSLYPLSLVIILFWGSLVSCTSQTAPTAIASPPVIPTVAMVTAVSAEPTGTAVATLPAEVSDNFSLTILHTNDVHAHHAPNSVGWLIAERESASLAQELIAATCIRQGIQPDQLTIHADRGSSMTSKSVTFLMADLGVTKTHSRPHVSNDNPFSEAQFTPALAGGARETLKYRPDYPERFGCQPDTRSWAAEFFQWYNHEHHHSALGLLTPADVHFGRAETILVQRQQVLQVAYQKNPEQFVKGLSIPVQLPKAVWINPPAPAPKMDSIMEVAIKSD